MMMRCLIIDDEPLAQDILESHINHYGHIVLVAKCRNAVAAFEIIHSQQVDLIFLDIQMPGISGINFVRSLKTPPKIVFTTAFSEYAATGFELDAVDYLLKPVTYELFVRSMQKVMRLVPENKELRKNYTYFKVSGKLIKIVHSDLKYAQSIKDYILLYTTGGRFVTHMTMKSLVEVLPAENFTRIHRSYLVNMGHIGQIGKAHLMIGPVRIPIGNLYRQNLNAII